MNVCPKFVALAAGACLGSAFAVVGCVSTDGPSTTSGQTESSGASSDQTASSGASSGQTGAPNASSGQPGTSGASPGDPGTSGASSGDPGTSGASSGQAGTPDATTATTDASSSQTGTPDASGGCPTYPGVTVTNVDAGAQSPTWSCVEKNCGTELATCAADCKCNAIILKAFFAAHDLTSANASFKDALANGSPPADAILVGVCLQTYQSSCPMWGSGSADAAAGD